MREKVSFLSIFLWHINWRTPPKPCQNTPKGLLSRTSRGTGSGAFRLMFISMAAADLNLVSVRWEQLAAAQSGTDLIWLEIQRSSRGGQKLPNYISKKKKEREMSNSVDLCVIKQHKINCESKCLSDFIYMKSFHKCIFLFCFSV